MLVLKNLKLKTDRGEEKPFVDAVTKIAMSQKKISADEKVYNSAVNIIISAIEMFNQLDEYQTMVDRYDMKDIKVLNCFKDLVLPAKIKWDANKLNMKNLIDRDVKNEACAGFNLVEYNIACSTFMGLFKKDTSESTSLEELRKSYDFSSIFDKCSFDSKAQYDGIPYIPIRVTVGSDVFHETYYPLVADDEVIINDYFANIKFNN